MSFFEVWQVFLLANTSLIFSNVPCKKSCHTSQYKTCSDFGHFFSCLRVPCSLMLTFSKVPCTSIFSHYTNAIHVILIINTIIYWRWVIKYTKSQNIKRKKISNLAAFLAWTFVWVEQRHCLCSTQTKVHARKVANFKKTQIPPSEIFSLLLVPSSPLPLRDTLDYKFSWISSK